MLWQTVETPRHIVLRGSAMPTGSFGYDNAESTKQARLERGS